MPFDLSNALASIQGYINKIMMEKLNIIMTIYLDNIVIYSNEADYV